MPSKALLFSATGWYRHPEIPAINGYLVRQGGAHGVDIHVSETAVDLEKRLKNYDVLILNNTNTLDKVFNEKQRKVIEDWYKAGGGIVALHAVLVRQDGWPWLQELGGCDFDSDSERLPAKVIVDPDAVDHPTVRGFGEAFTYTADWTNHTKTVTGLEGVQVLLRVDESTYDPVRDHFDQKGGKAMGEDHPVAWTRVIDGGRFFYTELGHDVASLDTPFGRQHLIEAIRWANQD
ncbi:MAG: ThuA domain-containing protein [Phycisphaeraceae bacterium]|nr:ThuA domain-containing protein [Phycisphaeraceae bacterium]